MKKPSWLWPALGVGTAVVTVVASYLIVRFAPSPIEFATLVLTVLLAILATFGYLGTKRGHAATFVALALVLPYLLIGTLAYASLERGASEVESIFEDDDAFAPDDEFFEDDDEFLGDGTYGSDPELDALQDECIAGDEQACTDLFLESPSGSEYESTAQEYGGDF
ncbi:hypothetical protein [Aeromicrobium sp. CF3.5]|uniref:hypothetical protein n=1 Tax=Aeromicrobium sp. CF3.5 TaxID=3373078 RepID=UPI003EE59199